ncbi:MAG: pseudouridine synthase [Lachnospiraceae bacterium]|nr:pseudouridine synthase [Lachnospiraceae bacterium]
MRINKYLSTMGYCSRREADRLIEQGVVCIDGQKAVPGSKISGGEIVTVGGKIIGRADDAAKVKKVVLAVNKPRGVVCTTTDNDRAPNIVDFVDYPERVYPVGRLDKDSEGLILMTNDGDLVNEILKASNFHEKEYEVEVDKPLTEAALKKMREGMYLKELDKSTRPCDVERTGARTFNIVLTQGLNRQIRRMCAECGYEVVKLKRIRIMGVRLGSVKEGKWKKINPEWLN